MTARRVMGPGVRRLALTAHIAFSVGWLGAVVAFLPLAVIGRSSPDVHTVRATYHAMEMIGWYALVPLSFGALVTGLVQALGTQWGLLRHYWVVVKLLIAVVSTIILLVYMQTLGIMAGTAAEAVATGAVPAALRSGTAVLHASAALVALLAATVLSVYKPRGLTPIGERQLAETGQRPDPESAAGVPRWVRVVGVIVLLVALLLAVRAVAGGPHGPHRHLPSAER